MRKTFKGIYLALILLFLYAPIVVMIVLSFNGSRTRAKWGGFSLKWYQELFTNSPEIMEALRLTISIAVLATVISVVLGTLAAIGIHYMKKRPASLLLNLSYLPMTMPDIVTGVSMMLMFVFISVPRGFATMLMAHIAFDTPYVLFSVLPKLRQMNPNTYEAAMDLGCEPFKAIRKVIVPEIKPGIITGALLSFTMSLDDFVISYFATDEVHQNLSTIIYSAAKMGIKPKFYALSTLMFLAVLCLLLIINKRSASALENIS